MSSDIPKYAVFNRDITDPGEDKFEYIGTGKTVADAVRDFKKTHISDVCNMFEFKVGSTLRVEVWTTRAVEESDWYMLVACLEAGDYPFDYCIHKKIAEFNLVYEG